MSWYFSMPIPQTRLLVANHIFFALTVPYKVTEIHVTMLREDDNIV